MIEALEKSLGVISHACRIAGIDRSTHYDWLLKDPDYKKAYEEIDEMAIDFVESKLFEKIKGVEISKGTDKEGEPLIYSVPPSDTAMIFFLKTRAKKRGYVERTEIDGNVKIETITGMKIK